MLPLLLFLLYWWSHAGASPQSSHSAAHEGGESGQDGLKPHIYYCRSPYMETFTCWWHPLDNGLQGDDNLTHRLFYTLGNRPPRECPDYVSGGPNSCYFDTEHTRIWEVYCMNVTAHSSRGSFTSKKHCLDVAEIVEIDPPYNLTYTLMNMTKDEAGCNVLVSWQYPIAQQVQIGWITLIYELRYRAMSEPSNWKVKERLREPHLELLGLSLGRYEVQVRCRSNNNHLWSKWSAPITIVIPSRRLPDHMVYGLVLMTTIVVIILLLIGFGIIPQGKRIKTFLLPPIPKPCIRGIDPMLLKQGKLDEINYHFSSLQGYKAPRYCGEPVYHVSMDEDVFLSRLSSMTSIQENKEPQDTQSPDCNEDQQLLHTPDVPSPDCQDPFFCSKETSEPIMTEATLWVWPEESHVQPELLSFPGTEYSMIVNPAPTNTSMPPKTQEFYTCVHGVTTNEMVQLVPCMSNSLRGSSYSELKDKPEEDTMKLSQLAAFLDKQVEVQANEMRFYPKEGGQNEYVVPLLPHPTDRS
ncbi:growth hormone receptor-like isoform X1 [Tachysurus fulvidraco]|uniref:growth hormone receptor-like isoform X1 n=1 Tax=Tachysurus fulvidraco TaxID=1234273 RepID=UPI000F5116EC|nr:growth hormone receptor-like isoform X1 [Tachysurus fulvidraco]